MQLLKIITFVKAVSDNVFDIINAVYHDKPVILIEALFHWDYILQLTNSKNIASNSMDEMLDEMLDAFDQEFNCCAFILAAIKI